jgi:hypothetical protein
MVRWWHPEGCPLQTCWLSNRASLTPRVLSGRSTAIPDGNGDGNDGSHQRTDAAVNSHLLSRI